MNSRMKRRQNQSGLIQLLNKTNEFQISTNVDKKKTQLIDKLNIIIESIGSAKSSGACIDDPIIISLQKIQDQAKLYDLKQIVKMTNLAIGKRILNIQLQRKRMQIQNKIEKKREIEDYFRENRVNKTNYQDIAIEKLKQHTFIVKPYSDGKAFVESTSFYQKYISSITGQSYVEYLEECNYLKVVKHVNKLFFNNFSNSSSQESRKLAFNHPLIRISFILLIAIASLCVAVSIKTIDLLGVIIFVLNLIMLFLLAGLVFHTYFHVKASSNQLEQTMINIREYFKELNRENKKMGLRHSWNCPDHFLYLQIKFEQE